MKKKDVHYFLSLSYPFTVEQFEENGQIRFGFCISDLPGVWADGETLDEALDNLNQTKKLWFETCIEKGIKIPEPVSEGDFSGKFLLRIPPELHKELSQKTKIKNISLNQFIRSELENGCKYDMLLELMQEIKSKLEEVKTKEDKILEHENRLQALENQEIERQQPVSTSDKIYQEIRA